MTRPAIIIDSREKTPWNFGDYPTVPGSLSTGDYSLEKFEDLICVERKSLVDIVGCIGKGRDRFKRELLRMRSFKCKAVIIEATLKQIHAGNWRGLVKPAHVLGSIASWRSKYSIEFIYAGNREQAADECKRLMLKYHDYCRRYASRFII